MSQRFNSKNDDIRYALPDEDIDNVGDEGYNKNKNGGENHGKESTKQHGKEGRRSILLGSGGRNISISLNSDRSSQLLGIVRDERAAQSISKFFKELYSTPETETQKDIAFLAKAEDISVCFAKPRNKHKNIYYFKDNLLIVNENITEKGYVDILKTYTKSNLRR